MSETTSYHHVLRSSSIIGAAHGLNYVLGLVRLKSVAVLLGPSGMGLIGLYQAAISVVEAMSSLGISSSGVREVAKAYGAEDPRKAAQTVQILRRACWFTGFFGWALAALLARPISEWVFGTSEHSLAIAILGATLLTGAVSGGQIALLQGIRRIGDLARVNIAAMLLNTAITIGLYAWLRQDGIVPVLLANAMVTLIVSWRFARRVKVERVPLTWETTLTGSGQLARLGVAFMWSALLIAALEMATRSVITREHGVEATGYFQAAWALSGMFAAFIINSMGMDFYPRLTGAIHDKLRAIQIVNEQTEIGILLAVPGILITMALAPVLIQFFYTAEFLPGAALLPWLLLGTFGRIISWPLGFIQIAKGAGRWFIATETVSVAFQLVLVILLVPKYGPIGAAYAFAATYAVYPVAMLWVGSVLIEFRWSQQVHTLLLYSGLAVAAGMTVAFVLSGWKATSLGAVIALMGGWASLRGLVTRLGPRHGLARACGKVPGLNRLLYVRSA